MVLRNQFISDKINDIDISIDHSSYGGNSPYREFIKPLHGLSVSFSINGKNEFSIYYRQFINAFNNLPGPTLGDIETIWKSLNDFQALLHSGEATLAFARSNFSYAAKLMRNAHQQSAELNVEFQNQMVSFFDLMDNYLTDEDIEGMKESY